MKHRMDLIARHLAELRGGQTIDKPLYDRVRDLLRDKAITASGPEPHDV